MRRRDETRPWYVRSRGARWAVAILLLITAVLWIVRTDRALALVPLVPATLLILTLPRHHRRAETAALWMLVALAPFSPVGFTVEDLPGPPRFVPLEMGLVVTVDGAPASRRSDVLLGGCVTTGFEPEWVWVW